MPSTLLSMQFGSACCVTGLSLQAHPGGGGHLQDKFTAAVGRSTHRRVVAFLSASQATRDVACELFFLDATPTSTRNGPRPCP